MLKKYWTIQLHYWDSDKMDSFKVKYKKDIYKELKYLYFLGKLDNCYLISIWKKGFFRFSSKNCTFSEFKNFLKN